MMDVSFDFETCALCPTAAVMSLGAVAWNRNAANSPFEACDAMPRYMEFSAHVDLRGMFVDGFTFDRQTADWWARRGDNAKKAVLASDSAESPCSPIQNVISDFFDWLTDLKTSAGGAPLYLWCQGTDFDMAILRNICSRYGMEIPVPYQNFRDHRTFFMEGARSICNAAGKEFNADRAYSLFNIYDGQGDVHDPIYDCKRSIYATWQVMKHQQGMNLNSKE